MIFTWKLSIDDHVFFFSLFITIGVVYISPSTGQYYPAFVHVYRCDTLRIAQKFLSRLQSYLLIESHRLRIIQLEKQLFEQNLLNVEHFHAMKSNKISTSSILTSSTNNSDHRQEKKSDPFKNLWERSRNFRGGAWRRWLLLEFCLVGSQRHGGEVRQ